MNSENSNRCYSRSPLAIYSLCSLIREEHEPRVLFLLYYIVYVAEKRMLKTTSLLILRFSVYRNDSIVRSKLVCTFVSCQIPCHLYFLVPIFHKLSLKMLPIFKVCLSKCQATQLLVHLYTSLKPLMIYTNLPPCCTDGQVFDALVFWSMDPLR